MKESFPESGAMVHIPFADMESGNTEAEGAEGTEKAEQETKNVAIAICAKRANVTHFIDLPEGKDFFDLLIRVYDGEGNPLSYKISSYGMRVLEPKY